jgi:hypothetical protein
MTIEKETYAIGWDVGGWNCDRNPNSRDAIVILDPERQIVGIPWRGNLRALINEAQTTRDWIDGLFALCDTAPPSPGLHAFLAIDTPLAFSQAFIDLTAHGRAVPKPLQTSQTNPYLYRHTERLLFDHGLRPLSAVKDLIGSQATKGMHVLAKFAPETAGCGVWTDGASLSAFEAYPSACKSSATITQLRAGYPALGHQDKEDALTCALLAALFAHDQEALWSPTAETPLAEGWIWVPNDVIA